MQGFAERSSSRVDSPGSLDDLAVPRTEPDELLLSHKTVQRSVARSLSAVVNARHRGGSCG